MKKPVARLRSALGARALRSASEAGEHAVGGPAEASSPSPKPSSFEDEARRGDAARDRRDFEVAAEAYSAALALRADALGLGVQLGHALKETGRYDAAEAMYRRFLDAHPQDGDIHLQLGHLFAVQDKGDEARPFYEKAAALDPEALGEETARALAALHGSGLRLARRQALALTDARRFATARERLLDLIDNHGCEDLTGILGNVCKELCDFEAAGAWYGRFSAYAQGRTPRLRIEAEMQLGHLAKLQRNYSGAIGHFGAAKDLIMEDDATSVTAEDVDWEIEACLGQITTSLVFR